MGDVDARARDLRARILGTPEVELRLAPAAVVAELMGSNGDTVGGGDRVRLAQAVLVHHGIEACPALDRAVADTPVRLRPTRRYAMQGAVTTTALATVAGLVGRPLYALVLAVAGALGAAFVARGPWFEHPPSRLIPAGRVQGVLAALLPIVIVALVVILPLRAHYRHEHDQSSAAQLLREADAALATGDLVGAQQKLSAAESSDPQAAAIANVRAQLLTTRVQAIVDDRLRRAQVYSQAEHLFAVGQVRQAIRLMSSIPGFWDADARVRQFQRALTRRR